MAVIRWSSEAAADLQAIHDFIASDSARYARAVCAGIVEAVDQLADFPQSGARRARVCERHLRELIRDSYRIVYRLRGDVVEVVTVYHGARLLRLERRTESRRCGHRRCAISPTGRP